MVKLISIKRIKLKFRLNFLEPNIEKWIGFISKIKGECNYGRN